MAGVVRFIADLHLSHENMARRRGFNSIIEHDEHIISEWNKVVDKRDVTYILGDVTMEKKTPYYLLDLLNGVKHVVLGNHDRRQDSKDLLNYVDSVSGMVHYKGFFLTHCPVHPLELNYQDVRGNIHGHIHDKEVGENRYWCVSCERVDYKPITIEELLKRSIYKVDPINESLKQVTRFEVIDDSGRALVRYGISTELSVQDEGRTLKVFLKSNNESRT
jgi:calcineurin-like phosphoesterase family protein